MIRVITCLSDEQKKDIQMKAYSLDNLCACNRCNALLQFNIIDISQREELPYLPCPCGENNLLPSKYLKIKPKRLDYVFN